MALKPTIAVPAGLGVGLVLVDLLALEANGLWLLGVFMVVFSAFRFHMQRLDAAREEAEQKEFEQELLAQKKRRKGAATLEMQQEKLRRDLEHEQELGKLNRKRS
jgi:hypothetical protein